MFFKKKQLPEAGTLASNMDILERVLDNMRVDEGIYVPKDNDDARIRAEIEKQMKASLKSIVLVDRETEWTYVGAYRNDVPVIYRLKGGDTFNFT